MKLAMFLLIGTFSLFSCARRRNTGEKTLKVRYVDFAVETALPVTTSGIDEVPLCTVDSQSHVESIMEILQAAGPEDPRRPFTDQTVRTKIYETSSIDGFRVVAVVEKHGAARMPRGDRLLSPRPLKDLIALLGASCVRR
jgi:hypothetical protein